MQSLYYFVSDSGREYEAVVMHECQECGELTDDFEYHDKQHKEAACQS
jgi:hypothetical protein